MEKLMYLKKDWDSFLRRQRHLELKDLLKIIEPQKMNQ